jgi:hypothetical protein
MDEGEASQRGSSPCRMQHCGLEESGLWTISSPAQKDAHIGTRSPTIVSWALELHDMYEVPDGCVCRLQYLASLDKGVPKGILRMARIAVM